MIQNQVRTSLNIFFCFCLFLTTSLYAAPENGTQNSGSSSAISSNSSNSNSSNKNEAKKIEAINSDTIKIESNLLNSLDYPELQVVPRASERIQMDAMKEQDNGWMMFWPFQLASGATMFAALMHKNRFNAAKENDEDYRKNSDFKVNAAVGLSASWFALTYFISATEPYTSELNRINTLKGKDKKTSLLKERLAEEAMQKPAELIKMLSYLSTITNLVAAGGLIDIVGPDYNTYAAIAMLTAFMPLIFKNKYIENYEKHLEYKRKIYTPVVFTDIYKPNLYSQWQPRLVMQWNF